MREPRTRSFTIHLIIFGNERGCKPLGSFSRHSTEGE
jgi:hypothetical protein